MPARDTLCIYDVYYEWDERKNRANQRKHGISFEIASTIFEDPNCLVVPDRIDDQGEPRWHALGATPPELGSAAILVVAHVYREGSGHEEVIRIISARAAEKHELRR